MQKKRKLTSKLSLASLATGLLAASLTAQAQTTDLKAGLKAYWNFDGNLNDSAGQFQGTENGAASIPFVNGGTGFGKAIQLDGTDQYVEITGGEPDDLAFAGGSVSISGWFKVGTFDKSWQALVAKGEGSNWRVARRGAEGGIAYAGGLTDTPTGKDVNDGNWHHFVAVSDADGAEYGTAMYIDGVRDTTIAGAAALTTNGKRMMVGENPDARGRYWNGEIDDLAIWGRVLKDAEITLLYDSGKAGKPLSILLGAVVGDADGDGMPDDWEKQYGFNPNNAGDAAQDANGNGISNLEEFKRGLDPLDTTKPVILSVAAAATFDTVKISYSKELDPATATNLANYAISPTLAVTAASYKNKVVTLTTAKQTAGAVAYTVTVTNVKDINNWTVAANTKATFYSYLLAKTGVLKFSYWGNITGTPVQGLYDDPRYPATPDLTATVFSFNSRGAFADDSHENYGATMEGFLTPTETADYRFFVYSDDASELYLSTDATEANLALIAQETGCCNNFTEPGTARTSEPVSLVAGKKYFIRMVYKEGGGGDYGQVAWRKEGDTTAAGSLLPIPGKYLSAAVDLPAPAEGLLSTQSPAPNAKNVSPIASVTVVHIDGKTEWTAANTSLKFNSAAVTPTFTKDGTTATIVFKPSAMLASGSTNKVTLSYKDPGGNDATLEWTFVGAVYRGPVKDTVKGYNGLLFGSANVTADKGGHTGKAGDYAIDLTMKGGPVQVIDPLFLAALNEATAKDELSVGLWIKKYDIADSSAIWFSSPTQGRVFQAHVPWSNNNIYFDTAGCCDAATQRMNAGIDTFVDYTGDIGWWTNSWNYFTFTKKADVKQVWINGKLFLEGSNTGLLSKDINQFNIGADNSSTGGLMHGLVDDVAIFSTALTEANILKLVAGTSPKDIGGVLALWEFNTVAAPEAPKFTSIVKNADGTFTITWTGGGTLQAAPVVNGPYTDVPGATSPYKVTPTGASLFGRIRQ